MIIAKILETESAHKELSLAEYNNMVSEGVITQAEIGAVVALQVVAMQLPQCPTEIEMSFEKAQYPDRDTWHEIMTHLKVTNAFTEYVIQEAAVDSASDRQEVKITLNY